MNKFFRLLIICIVGCLLTSCVKIFTPSEPHIGWDGNYFYYNNYKCQTNLTNEEYLIETIEYNNKKYTMYHRQQSVLKKEKLHMICGLKEVSNAEEQHPFPSTFAYIIYSLIDNNIEYFISWDDLCPREILEVNDTYTIIFANRDNYNFSLLKVDINNNIVNTYDYNHNSWSKVYSSNGYIAFKKNDEILVGTSKDFTFKSLDYQIKPETTKINIKTITVNNRNILQIVEESTIHISGYPTEIHNLTYYDFDNNKYYELVKFEDKKYFDASTHYFDVQRYEELFILGTPTPILCKEKKEEVTKIVRLNSILCSISINGDNLIINEKFKFDENREYYIGRQDEMFLTFSFRELSKDWLGNYSLSHVRQSQYMEKGNYKLLDLGSYEDVFYISHTADVFYYIKTVRRPSLMGPNFDYYLFRKDATNNPVIIASFNYPSYRPKFYDYVYENNNEELSIFTKTN